MGRIAVLGERARVADFALAGALTLTAGTAEEVRRAWETLPPDVLVVALTPAAARALGPVQGRLTVIMAERAGEGR
ncbi:hypothetical protein [Nonomuraea harbinensis]|uniref:Uncharacterized protein n=1 Tax=Nonomuraea harbinensis TaxID=1286938 RepID=A0ABW1CA96_9ACTN|nr:hypothetical protein [Nonomuraea harbinensis]